MEWEMMRGMADGQEPGAEGGRSPTGGPGSCPSAAAREALAALSAPDEDVRTYGRSVVSILTLP